MAIELVRDEMQVATEVGLPGYMFSLLFDSLRQNTGMEVRSDLEELANKASAAHLVDIDMFRQRRIAKQMETDGYAILKAANTDDLKLLIGAFSRMLCTLATRQVGIEENALMIALAIAAEIDEDEDQQWGNPKFMNVLSAKMDNEARKLGYFVAIAGENTPEDIPPT